MILLPKGSTEQKINIPDGEIVLGRNSKQSGQANPIPGIARKSLAELGQSDWLEAFESKFYNSPLFFFLNVGF